MAEKIILIIFIVPVYGFCIWMFFNPEEGMLLGRRWTYKEEPVFSEMAIRFTKVSSIIAIFLLTISLVAYFFSNYLVKFLFIIGLVICMVIVAYKLFTK